MSNDSSVWPPAQARHDESGGDCLAVQENKADRGEQAVASLSRRNFLALGAATCGAAALLTTQPAEADVLDLLKKFLYLDDIVLNYAHEMEELQADFFLRALHSDAASELDMRERSALAFIATQDRAHFEALDKIRDRRGAKGGGHFATPNASSSQRARIFTFPAKAFHKREDLMPLAVDIKESCVAAYHGAVHLVHDKKLLGPAAGVAGVDGRHLAVLREIAGLDPIPSSFENQVSPQTIGDRLARFGFKGGGMRG